MSARIDFDASDLAGLGRRLLALASAGLTPVMRDVAEAGASATMKRILLGGPAPDGTPWRPRRDPLNPRPLLNRAGHLSDSLTARSAAGAAEWGSRLVYAGVHQAGAVIRGRPWLAVPVPGGRDGDVRLVRQVEIPARPYLGIGDGERRMILDVVASHLRRGSGDRRLPGGPRAAAWRRSCRPSGRCASGTAPGSRCRPWPGYRSRGPAILCAFLAFDLPASGRLASAPDALLSPGRPTPQAHLDVHLAAIALSGLPEAGDRAAEAADVAAAAVPALVADAWRDIAARNFYDEDLYRKGVAAIVITGVRKMAAQPPPAPRARPVAAIVEADPADWRPASDGR